MLRAGVSTSTEPMRNEDEHCEFEICSVSNRDSVSHDGNRSIKATLLEERSLHFNRSLRVVHRLLRGHLVPRIRTPVTRSSLSSAIQIKLHSRSRRHDLICSQSAPSRLVRGSSSPSDISPTPSGSIKDWAYRQHLRYLGFHEKWRVRPQKHITWE